MIDFCINTADIVGNAVLFGLVVFLIGKAVWQDYEPFKPWKEWIKEYLAGRWERWKSHSGLRQTYFGLAVFVVGLFLYSFYFIFPEFLNKITDKDTSFYNLSLAVFAIVSGLGAVFGFYTSILRTETAQQGLITERLNKAVEGLGKSEEKKPVVEVRLGALYALERIAQDSLRDHIQIMEILCAYIRHNSKNNDTKTLREDIQAALTIIGRRDKWPEGKKYLKKEKVQKYHIDLRNCNLQGAKLSNTNFSRADFEKTNLQGAKLDEANLKFASFSNTNLSKVSFFTTNLQNASFFNTNMREADIILTDMRNNSTSSIDMSEAKLSTVNLTTIESSDINMKDAKINQAYAYTASFSTRTNITQEQLDQMFCGKNVKIPKGLKRPKHWPTSDLSYDEFEKARIEWLKKVFNDPNYNEDTTPQFRASITITVEKSKAKDFFTAQELLKAQKATKPKKSKNFKES